MTNPIDLTSLILTCLAANDAQTARELATLISVPTAVLATELRALVADGCVVTSGLAGGTRYCLAIDEITEQAAATADGHRSHADLMTAWQTPVGQLPLDVAAREMSSAFDLLDAARAARTDYERAENGVGFQWGPIAVAMEQSASGLEEIIAGRVASALPSGYILTPGMVQAHRDRATDARSRATAQLAIAARDLATLPTPVLECAIEIALDRQPESTQAGQAGRTNAISHCPPPSSTGNLMTDLEATAEGLIAGRTLGQLSARGVA